MTGTHNRRYMIGALIAALVAGWLVGWLWGAPMHGAMGARADLDRAAASVRELDYAIKDGLFETVVIDARAELESASSDPDAHPDDIRDARTRLRRAEAELAASPRRLDAQRARLAEAKSAYGAHSAWYNLFRLTEFSGKLFLNLLNLLVIPLVVASLVIGVTALGDIRHVGRTGMRTIIYYFATTAVAVTIGLVLVQVIAPGAGVEGAQGVAGNVRGKEAAGVLDTLLRVFINTGDPARGAFPSNIFAAMAEMNVLGVIVFTVFFASALTTIGERGRPVVAFFEGVNDTVMRMIHWVLYLLPIGVFGLVVARLAHTGGGAAVWGELARVGWYAATVISGLAVHAVVVIPLILWVLTGRSPIKYLSGMAQALLTAFSTASSSATLPTTMECAEVNNRVSARAASFVLPIGATINMDGTALYEAVAVVFIAQVYGVPMTATILLVVFLTATLAAVGAAGIPEAGLVTMVIVLNATGLPLEGIAVLLSIDWFLDRCRTTVNVWGDAVGAAVIDRFETEAERP